MKISGPGGLSQTSTGSASRSAAAPGFSVSVSTAGEAAPMARTAAATGVTSLDALLALQETEGPVERKRRAVKRAGRLLDVLDEVKLALLGGDASTQSLQRLAQAVREQRAETEDTHLEGVLDEIETRAAVELAKAEMSRLAA
jgi:hypothetical protein